jgi:ATP-dependent DNA helicase PIF1
MVLFERRVLQALHLPSVFGASNRPIVRIPLPSFRRRNSLLFTKTGGSLRLSSIMFKRAVDVHNASQRPIPAPSTNSSTQQTGVNTAFKPPFRTTPQPLSTTTGNISKTRPAPTTKNNAGSFKVNAGLQHGLKRTSSGLAKVLDTSIDQLDYARLSMGNLQDNAIWIDDDMGKKSSTAVYFDENDFESDIDLEIEEPSVKSIVEYPKLPSITPPDNDASSAHLLTFSPGAASSRYFSNGPATSSHAKSIATAEKTIACLSKHAGLSHHAPESFRSSFPHSDSTSNHVPPISSNDLLPWSSSPAEQAARNHRDPILKIPDKPISNVDIEPSTPRPAKRSRRGILPWNKEGESMKEEVDVSSVVTSPRKRGRPKGTTNGKESTPLSKNIEKDVYAWNTTASAIKEQQKKMKQEQKDKKMRVKESEITDDILHEAAARKKKTRVSRVFLSEEQQHVLNLVVEQRRSVFFTGSAGMLVHMDHLLRE